MTYIIAAIVAINILVIAYYHFHIVKPMRTIANGMDLLREQDFSSRLSPVGQKEADRLVKMFNDMMNKLKNERVKLEEQQFFLTQLVRVSPMGVVVFDYDGNVTMKNESAERFLSPDNGNLANEIEKMKRGEERIIRLSDSQIYRCYHLSFTDRGFARSFLLIESLTDEVFNAEKKAYEKVIRMIAHEVNNTMAGVGSIFETLKEQTSTAEPELSELMQVCVDRCQSMGRFITRFADVVKIPEPSLHPCDINYFICSRRMFLESLCSSSDIRLHLNLCPDELTAKIDEPLFEQVLTNIVKNSVESIGQSGEITISTYKTDRESIIEITDNGKGLSAEAEQRIFSPFFTTKPNGQGIGLLFVRDVLRSHNFRFSLRTSKEDNLTRFRISYRLLPDKR